MGSRTAAICALLISSIWLGACAHSVRSTNWSESIHAQADAFALGAEIALLRDGDQPELRVWASNVMDGEVIGRITTSDRGLERTLSSRIDDSGAMTLTHRAYRDSPAPVSPASLREALSQLHSLDGQNWGCAFDGVSFLVDGVVDGHRFTFAVSNPDFCDDDRSRQALQGISAMGPSTWRPMRR